MATISSSPVKFTQSLSLNPSTNQLNSLSSSTSVIFSSHNFSARGGFGLYVDRPAKRGLSCNCLFGLGVPELVVIAGVTTLLFGPKQIPEMGRSIGKTVKSFQQAAREFESELRKDSESAEPSNEKITQVSEEEKQEVKVAITEERY